MDSAERGDGETQKPEKMFTLKKWNAVAMWSWDVECDTCAICRVQVMGKFNELNCFCLLIYLIIFKLLNVITRMQLLHMSRYCRFILV